MSVTVSSKYQVVIPKAVRRQLGIKPGQKLKVRAGKNGSVILKKDSLANSRSIDSLIDKYAGIAQGAWGPDPVATLRKMRDEEWD
ncbi:MAG TPA: AbrB/MazE/SpoVT family DNA-binding domain-containing protein [Candidatus Saccharimonadales bacterium]|jgi:AbrB family looped-hinge helix DNA binding protein|nr:AbrB/MazE/SpoVT family DNA-binding domain-containing protein [Candidatus Saccharimonadales bacterium]